MAGRKVHLKHDGKERFCMKNSNGAGSLIKDRKPIDRKNKRYYNGKANCALRQALGFASGERVFGAWLAGGRSVLLLGESLWRWLCWMAGGVWIGKGLVLWAV